MGVRHCRGDTEIARAMLQWLSGDDKVAASARKHAFIAGKLGHQDVLGMLRALSTMVMQAGCRGLVVLIDEVNGWSNCRDGVHVKY